MSESLFGLDAEYQRLRIMAEEQDLTDEDLADTLEGMEDEWLKKMDSCVFVIKLLNADLEALDKEEKAIAAKKKSISDNIEKIKKRMFDSVKLRYPGDDKGSKVPSKCRFKYWTQKSKATAAIVEGQTIPEEFYDAQAPKLNKDRLAKALTAMKEAGQEMPKYATLERTEFLTWR